MCGNATVVAQLQAARAMLTVQRLHELKVATKELGEDAPFPFEPSNYKQLAQQLPAPATQLDIGDSGWRVADGEARGRVVARLLRVSGSLATLRLGGNDIGDGNKSATRARGRSRSALLSAAPWQLSTSTTTRSATRARRHWQQEWLSAALCQSWT